MKRKIRNLISYLKTNYNYLKHKEVKPKHLFYGQMQPARAVDMLDALNKQIQKFQSNFNDDQFIFVEIGSYLGESLNLFGNNIHNKLQNYLLISIDPYSSDAINKGEMIIDKIKTPREMKISVHPSKPWSAPKNTKKIISKIFFPVKSLGRY